MGEITERAMQCQCHCKIPICLTPERFTPSIKLSVMHLGDYLEETTIPQLVTLASRRPEEHSEEKLNHFKLPGQWRSLNEQRNANVLQAPICLTWTDLPPQLFCQQKTVKILLILTGWGTVDVMMCVMCAFYLL